ncbi:MAG TPA: hypothetical protein VEP66_01525 [Myxococcales bacterium]|nr:hypothetical protein [Myxococcales bacterium]
MTKRFLCLICAERLMEQMSPVEAKRHLGQYGALTAELLERGQLVERNRLLPAETAATVRVRKNRSRPTPGPTSSRPRRLPGT